MKRDALYLQIQLVGIKVAQEYVGTDVAHLKVAWIEAAWCHGRIELVIS